MEKNKNEHKKFNTLDEVLNYNEFENEYDAIIINNDIPITITDKERKLKEGIVKYTNAKKEGKSGKAFTIIAPNTLAVYTSENIKYHNPVNWTETIDKAGIFQRSHIIGYRLSARINNINNIFIGTEHLNKISMYEIEQEIYNDVKIYKRKYLYKVTPIYKFEKDFVPIGVLIEAETVDKLKKNTKCRFCYNIQKEYKINYYDGSNKTLEEVIKNERKKAIVKNPKESKKEENLKFRDYKIDIKNGIFHSYWHPCDDIKKMNKKYVQETTADKDEVLSKKDDKGNQIYSFCKKCVHFK